MYLWIQYFFLYRDFTDYTSGFICVKKKIFENYKLKGNYGDYFVNLIVYCKLNNNSIIELPFIEKERYSGSSKTAMFGKEVGGKIKISIRGPFDYFVLSLHYLFSLINNFFRNIYKIDVQNTVVGYNFAKTNIDLFEI